jgi:hypothetical protein
MVKRAVDFAKALNQHTFGIIAMRTLAKFDDVFDFRVGKARDFCCHGKDP